MKIQRKFINQILRNIICISVQTLLLTPAFCENRNVEKYNNNFNVAYQISPAVPNGSINDVFVVNNYAYICEEGGFSIVDISDYKNPRRVSQHKMVATDAYVAGKYAYVLGRYDWEKSRKTEFHVIDISDIKHPFEVGRCEITGLAEEVYLSENYAYTKGHKLILIEVSNPSKPKEVGIINQDEKPTGLYISDKHLYVASFASADECVYPSFRVFDVSNPKSLSELDYTKPQDCFWRFWDIAVINAYAYAISSDSLYTFNINISSSPVKISDHKFKINNNVGKYFYPKKISVRGKYAYVIGNASGKIGDKLQLRKIDISLPSQPSLRSYYTAKGEAKELFVTDDLIFIASGKHGLIILNDIKNH